MAQINQTLSIQVLEKLIQGTPFGQGVLEATGIPVIELSARGHRVRLPQVTDGSWASYEDTRTDIGSDVRQTVVDMASVDLALERHAHEYAVNEDDPFSTEALALETELAVLRQSLEVEVAKLISTPSNYNSSGDPVNKWDTAPGTPISDISAAVEAVSAEIGSSANTLIIPRKVVRALLTNTEVTDLFKATSAVTEESLAAQMKSAFGFQNVAVTDFHYMTKIDPAGGMLSPYDSHVAVVYNEGQSNLPSPRWAAVLHEEGYPKVTRRVSHEETVVRVRDYWKTVVLNSTAGYLITNALS